MTDYRTDLNNWIEVYDYLTRLYQQRESEYVHSGKVAKPDVIIPRSNVPNAGNKSYFQPTNRSFQLGAEYNMRHESFRCSIQVRKYNSGEHLYSSIHHDNNIYLGTDVPAELEDVDKELYYVQLNWKNPEATTHEDLEQSVRALIGHLFLDVLGYNPGDYFKQACSDGIRN